MKKKTYKSTEPAMLKSCYNQHSVRIILEFGCFLGFGVSTAHLSDQNIKKYNHYCCHVN